MVIPSIIIIRVSNQKTDIGTMNVSSFMPFSGNVSHATLNVIKIQLYSMNANISLMLSLYSYIFIFFLLNIYSRLNSISQKFISTQNLRTWCYLDIGSFQKELRILRKNYPIFRVEPKFYDCCPHKKRRGHTKTQRRDHVKTEAELGVMQQQAQKCQGLLAANRS